MERKTMTYPDICLERAEKAHKELCLVCAKPSRFTMSIPVHPTDTDMVIQASLDDSKELARRLSIAIRFIRNEAILLELGETLNFIAMVNLADELEAPLEGK